MKKLLVPSILFALAGMLFSSCSNSSKLAFTKRHYRSGYFTDRVVKINTHNNPSVSSSQIRATQVSTAPLKVKSNNQPVINTQGYILQKAATVHKNKVQKEIRAYNPTVVNSISTNQNALLVNTSTTTYSSYEEEHEGHVQADADVSFIVIVLCAIFLPPLGVALSYGINSYFWIDLVLTLIFFFPGMIFALIVVLM